jgi:hypothetical protein
VVFSKSAVNRQSGRSASSTAPTGKRYRPRRSVCMRRHAMRWFVRRMREVGRCRWHAREEGRATLGGFQDRGGLRCGGLTQLYPSSVEESKIWSDDAALFTHVVLLRSILGYFVPCPHCAETSWYWLLVHTALKEPQRNVRRQAVCRGLWPGVEQDFSQERVGRPAWCEEIEIGEL